MSCLRITVAAALALVSTAHLFLSPPVVYARHIATFCKWPFDWPHTVHYVILDFYGDAANRVQYGANTWTEANFNLILNRNYDNNNPNRVFRGPMDPGHEPAVALARVYVERVSGTTCTTDPHSYGRSYWKIVQGEIIFNVYKNFHADCLAAGTSWCAQNGYHDLHNVSSHEFGHWFHLQDNYYFDHSADTMYFDTFPGEVQKRTLAFHDRDSAWAMYGCRNGKGSALC